MWKNDWIDVIWALWNFQPNPCNFPDTHGVLFSSHGMASSSGGFLKVTENVSGQASSIPLGLLSFVPAIFLIQVWENSNWWDKARKGDNILVEQLLSHLPIRTLPYSITSPSPQYQLMVVELLQQLLLPSHHGSLSVAEALYIYISSFQQFLVYYSCYWEHIL